MAKKIPGATQSAASQRIQRTEAYAGTVKRMFDETVNDILKLKLAKPTEEGVMYSFDGDTIQVRKRVEELLKRLHSSATLAVKKGIQAEWGIANKEMDDLVKATFGKKLFESDRFRAWTGHNEDAMNAFVNRTDKGMNLSDRVWQASRQLRDEMEVALTVGMGSGESAASMSRAVRQCLNDPDLMFRRFRYKKGEDENGNPIYGKKWKKKVIVDGKTKWIDYDKDSYIPKGAGGHSRGVYRSAAKNAMRVARTETNMAYRRADYERWQKMDFVLGIRIELSNQHPIPDICDDMQGDYPKNFYFGGWHPHCYPDDAMVLTDEGWKLFSDVRGDELILSLNPETRESEWTTITDRQCWRNDGAMRHFRNKSLDCLVTPEHRMVYLNKSDGRIEYTTADDYRKGKGAFYRGCLNTNPDRDTIGLCGKVVSFDWFCEFMGYYLSDGSTIRTSQITIAQKDGERSKDTVRKCIERAGFRVTSREYVLDFYDKELCTYLKQFGLYYEKYVPSEILNASQRQIRIFLDAFSICDGYRRKPKPFTGSHGHAFCSDREEVMYYTTSQRMAGNLSELILKVGGRPSFSIQQPQTAVKKDGSQIVGKYPCFRIAECKSVTATVFTDETVEYHGNVYDLTLEKNHIMYVARNGKCFWGSNCFCYATPILVSEDEMAKVTEEFMEGRTYVPKGEPVLDTPPAFKQWVADNSDRIRNASSLPYWIKDNPQFVDARKGAALTPDPDRLKAQIEKKGITLTSEEARDQKIAEAAQKRHATRPEGYREELLAKRQLTQDIDALLGKAEDFGWNANISSLKDALHDMRFSKDAAITTEKLQKEYDTLKESINKQKKVLGTTAANLEKLANKYGYSQEIKALADAMSDTQTYTELHQKQRELAKAISAEKKAISELQDLIPDVKDLRARFTIEELRGAHAAIKAKFDRWTWDFDTDTSLSWLKNRLEQEIKVVETQGRKYSTWEVSRDAFKARLELVEKRIDMKKISDGIAADMAILKKSKGKAALQLVKDFEAAFKDNNTNILSLRAIAQDITKKANALQVKAAKATGAMTDDEIRKAFIAHVGKAAGLKEKDIVVKDGYVNLTRDQHLLLHGKTVMTQAQEDYTWARGTGWDKDKGYIRTSNSFKINGALRDIKHDGQYAITGDVSLADITKCADMFGKKLNKDDVKTIKVMDMIIQGNPSPMPIRFSRFVDENAIENMTKMKLTDIEKAVKAKKAVTTHDHGFMSLSTDAEANVFKTSRDYMLEIEAPKGTPMYITKNTAESEAILGRGTKMEIVEIREEFNGYNNSHKLTVLRCRVIP